MSEKKNTTLTFAQGINTDISDELLPSGMYRGGKNIRLFSNGDLGIITTPKGNVQIPFDIPAGRNVCIGAKSDTENNKFYFFLWNENGYHGIYQYDNLLEKVNRIILNLADTADVDILQFQEKALILHINVKQELLYWVSGVTNAMKINIAKALDKSDKGYGSTILKEYISAYKRQPVFAPTISYFTDTAKLTNYVYGKRFKATVRHIFDDNEKSNFSEFSAVPNPTGESIFGNSAISNKNNALKISVETGSAIVKKIEIGLKINNLDFVSIATLDKKVLGISDNSTYVYTFYNDNVSYSGLAQILVERAFSYIPDKPFLQAITDNAMVYGNGEEGFEPVTPIISTETVYSPLFLPDTTESKLNEPEIKQSYFDYVYSKKGDGRRRWSDVRITIKNDVKKGNHFELWAKNGQSDNQYFDYTADINDDAISVANQFKQKLKATGQATSSAPEGLPTRNIDENEIDGDGNVSFRFIWRGRFDENATNFATSKVNPVNYDSLKDTGEAVPSQKSGGSVKYGIIYWNEDTKRSDVYTAENAVVRNSFVTETNGYKKIVHRISIKHQPPIWATHWELVRTVDLTYGNDYIHVLIQQAIESQSTTDTQYVDLVVGSLFTYQRMYPNTVIKFKFEKNDRVRLIRKEDDVVGGEGGWYPFYETTILDYKDEVIEEKNENITTDGTATVVIEGTTSDDNIGRNIQINGVERLIIGVASGTSYTLDRNVKFPEVVQYPSYKIIDRRGIIRVRKPQGITIAKNSLIEVYKPTQNKETAEKQFFLFGKKFDIINWGTETRSHGGSNQNQNPADLAGTPAIVEVVNGTSFVRGRSLPTNNTIPGTQVIVDFVEDKMYSDFYESDLNDNGKIAVEDNGYGVRRFPDRLRFSSVVIEDTKVNNLNDFDSSDRKDYNDIYGGFKLLVYKNSLLYAFKELRSGYIPVYATIISDKSGNDLLGASKQLLNDIKYFNFNGGIGNNPESYAESDTWMFFASVNSGTFCRIGGDGILPISEQFGVDKKIKELFLNVEKYGTRIFGGFDKANNEYIPSFESFKPYVYNSGFQEVNWKLLADDLDDATEYEITTQGAHGTVTINGDNLFVYTPNTDYVGVDSYYYRWREPGGEWSEPKKECVNVEDVPEIPRTPLWVVDENSAYCIQEGGYSAGWIPDETTAFCVTD